MTKGRFLVTMLALAGAAFSLARASRLQDNYELGLRTQLLTEALVEGRTRDIYWMFVPQFRAEQPFARFDSAVRRWQKGRRIGRASRKVVDIKGVGGHVSSWVVFEGASDYSYLYQSWLRVGRTWQLVWVSRILDTTFSYGQSDTAAMRAVAERAVGYALSRKGLERFRRGFVRPDTVILIRHARPEEGFGRVEGAAVEWLSEEQARERQRTRPVRFLLGLSGIKVFGNWASLSVDLHVTDAADGGRFGQRRGMELYLEKKRGGWEVNSVGKVW